MKKLRIDFRDSLFIELLCIVSILFYIVLTLVFFYTNTSLSNAEREWLKKSPLGYAIVDNAYPFSYRDGNGTYGGIVSDVAGFVGSTADVTLQPRQISSPDEALEAIRRGEVHFIGAVTLPNPALRGVIASDAYAALSDVVVTSDGIPLASTSVSLEGKRVAVSGAVLDTNTVRRAYGQSKSLTVTEDLASAITLLRQKQVDAVVALAAPVRYYFMQHPSATERIIGSTGTEFVLTFLVQKDRKELHSIMNKCLRLMGEQEHAVILESWFGVSQKGQFLGWNVRKSLTLLGGMFVLFMAIVLVWNRKLRRDVHKQNRLVLLELAERKLTEHKLLRNQSLMQSIFNASQNVYYVFDEFCVCQNVITSREDLLDFCHVKDPVGAKLDTLFDDDIAGRIRTSLLKSLDCKRLQIIEYRVKKGSKERWMEGRALTLAHSGCGPRKIVWIARDITEEKRNREGVRVLSTQLALSEEQQRRKIAVELHDSLGQILAIVKMQLNILKKRLTDAEEIELLESVMEQIGNGIDLTRTLVWELSPPTLYALGLVSAVEWLGERFSKEYFINFSVEDSMECSIWGSDFKILLFRIVRELMTNVVKHSKAASCNIAFHSENDGVLITVQDDGCGFKQGMTDTGFRKGFGLLTIQESVRHLGGDVVFSSNKRGGHVRIFIPFKKAAPSVDVELFAATGTI